MSTSVYCTLVGTPFHAQCCIAMWCSNCFSPSAEECSQSTPVGQIRRRSKVTGESMLYPLHAHGHKSAHVGMQRHVYTGTPCNLVHCTLPFPSGGHALLDIDSKPTLRDLDALVIGKVAHMEDRFPLHLGIERYVIATAAKNHPNDCERALREVLDRWLEGARGTGGEDRTWHSILRALDRSRKGELVKQLRTEWFKSQV